MPVATPPLGGPVGRSRMRISASGLVSWERCPRQWFHRSKQGLSGPVNERMILGIHVEDALVGLLMEDPGYHDIDETPSWVAWKEDKPLKASGDAEEPESLADIRQYLLARLPATANKVIEICLEEWKLSPSTSGEFSSDIDAELVKELLLAGVEMQLEEVQQCFDEGGGPNLSRWRQAGDPHFVRAPRWAEEPRFPIPDKVPGNAFRLAQVSTQEVQPHQGEMTWSEAWRIARPWMKDPRVWQAQRLYHPEGWAAGELDMLLRWNGKATIVDIKSGDGSSGWATGLPTQLRFYQWLFTRTREDQHLITEVEALEGWYLGSGDRHTVDIWTDSQLVEADSNIRAVWEQMSAADGDRETWPVANPSPWKGESTEDTCRRCHARFICSFVSEEIREEALQNMLPHRMKGMTRNEVIDGLSPREPARPISEIPSRVNITGNLGGKWGPMSNHYGEPVHGAVLSTGSKASVVIEEMAPGAFLGLKDANEGPCIITDAAPGVWRGSSRVYLDARSSIIDTGADVETTRLGLLPTRANVDGLVVSRRTARGVRVDGKPWTMMTCHLWDGHDTIEVVVFGWGATETFSDIRVGDRVLATGAELGWRAGLPQLRISPRGSRIDVRSADWMPGDGLPDSIR